MNKESIHPHPLLLEPIHIPINISYTVKQNVGFSKRIKLSLSARIQFKLCCVCLVGHET